MENPEVDVAIIGLGPVGATLANLLGMLGVRTRVLEREAASYHLPRAVNFDDEIMRVFDTIGLGGEVAAKIIPSPGMRFVDRQGHLLLDWRRPPVVTDQGYFPSFRFHQPDLEETLRQGIARWSCVDIGTRCDVFSVEPSGETVRVRYEDLGSGELKTFHARFVVGCDGSRSTVRRFLGSTMNDLGFNERWLVTDVILKKPAPELGDYSIQFCDPDSPATYVRGTGERRRWEFKLRADETGMTDAARVWQRLSRWLTPDDATIERAAVYTFRSAVAQTWRAGPLLIAGDAAHQTPPFLGQGMGAGIRDAANLAWKLARVLGGRSPERLLDSYQAERMPHANYVIGKAVEMGALINDAQARAGPSGRDPQLILAKPGLVSASLSAHPLIGTLAPQPRSSDGQLADRQTGYAFTFLCASPPGRPLDSFLAREHIAVAGTADPHVHRWLAHHGVAGVLARPDRYILSVLPNGKDTAEADMMADFHTYVSDGRTDTNGAEDAAACLP